MRIVTYISKIEQRSNNELTDGRKKCSIKL